MNIIFEQEIDPTPTPNNRSPSHPANTDSAEARHRVLPDSTKAPALDRAARTVRNHNRQRQVLPGSSELADEAFYWFLTAPALVYVAHLAFGL
ncbi:MAG: hypothetical protein JO025_26215 [Verrucomicrobia bacterium]|nr:hypothetical protein [Verrucomicrobiota bacterium]